VIYICGERHCYQLLGSIGSWCDLLHLHGLQFCRGLFLNFNVLFFLKSELKKGIQYSFYQAIISNKAPVDSPNNELWHQK
jgi:hypothetical protein